MRSHVEVTFQRQGTQLGSPLLLNQVNVHPDITDAVSWEDFVSFGEAIYHGFTGQWEDAWSDVKKLYETAIKEKDVNAERKSEVTIGLGGIGGNGELADEARVWFRAWSEDDLTKSFARVDPPGQIQDLGERFFRQGDENWYEHGFSVPVRPRDPNTYIFSFASGDDGWHFDVGVASFLSIFPVPSWHHNDPGVEAGGAPAAIGDPCGFTLDGQHVFYRTVDDHIHELFWNGGWHHNDPGVEAGGAPEAAGDPCGFVLGNSQHVFYRAVDGHIHELFWA